MNFRYLIFSVLLTICTAEAARSQNTPVISTRKQAELLIPRPHLLPVRSMEIGERQVLDTIETQTPGVMIILYEDHSWKYYRDPNDIMRRAMFTENWSSELPNPYRVSLEALPDKISIWVVDTLGEYRCPVMSKVYSPFGYRHRRRHQGVDLPLKKGDNVYAAFSGEVRMSRYYKAYGNLVIIRHENGLETFYGHLSKRLVDEGQWVDAGQVIGLGGSTGRSTGPHLHFETRYQGYTFDPQWLIDFDSGTLRHRLFVLKKKFLNAGSRYVPESEAEEDDILQGDARDYAVADSIAAAKKIEEERLAAAAAKYHKIRSGDTLYGIARKYGTSAAAICRLNSGMTTKSVLKIGKTIRVK